MVDVEFAKQQLADVESELQAVHTARAELNEKETHLQEQRIKWVGIVATAEAADG